MLSISLRPDGRHAVVVGGGAVAARKVESLVTAGFHVFVVAPKIDERLAALLVRCGGASAERAYQHSDLNGASLAIAATDDPDTNAGVIADARAARVLACDAAAPTNGDFTMAATARIGELTLSVDSGGASPAFARRVARELGAALGPQYGRAVEQLSRMRAYVKDTFPSGERAGILRALAEQPVAELAAMDSLVLTCASRASRLAMTQTRTVAARLAQRGIATTILSVTTTGDRDRSRAIHELGENVFVTELETALRERRADYAVHSCKDLPSRLAEDVQIAAVCAREDPRDAFCSRRFPTFDALAAGSTVGTSSPRRRVQLAAMRPDLRYEEMRGNVDTRLRRLDEERYDAIVLAMAGLNRLHLRAPYTVPFSVEAMVPAVAQGALAVETRVDDEHVAQRLYDALNDAPTALCVFCERAALRALRAGCNAPIGIHAVIGDGTMVVRAVAADAAGTLHRETLERRVDSIEQAEALGADIAARLQLAIGGSL